MFTSAQKSEPFRESHIRVLSHIFSSLGGHSLPHYHGLPRSFSGWCCSLTSDQRCFQLWWKWVFVLPVYGKYSRCMECLLTLELLSQRTLDSCSVLFGFYHFYYGCKGVCKYPRNRSGSKYGFSPLRWELSCLWGLVQTFSSTSASRGTPGPAWVWGTVF